MGLSFFKRKPQPPKEGKGSLGRKKTLAVPTADLAQGAAEKFQFLKESPQTGKQGLGFGHKEIVATLSQIITTQQHNLTIGLFGGWGSGKSSIVENLKVELKVQKVPLVIFDVWKHEGDALRRTFLTELVAKLDTEYGKEYFKENFLSNQRMRFSMSSAQEFFSIKWQRLLLHLLILLVFGCMLFGILAFINAMLSYIGKDFFSEMTGEQIGLVAGTAFSAAVLYKYVDYFIKVEKTEYKEERFQDPHEFEREFARIIDNLSKTTNKIVVTFDNMDRVSGDNALKIISTIKTFLDYTCEEGKEQKTVYFLIPCDVASMKQHIALAASGGNDAEKLDGKEVYWDEFLRKFFNTSFWIPEFYPTELEAFAVARLKEVNVKAFNDDYLSWMIIKVFNKNPRQIIQFINILLSNYLLLKQFCQSGEFHDREFYRSNVPQLAKFLLIKQRHSSVLDDYLEKCVYDLNDADMLAEIKDPKFQILLKQTEGIFIPSLEPYFKYRLSKEEQDNQAIVQFVKAVVTGDENVEEMAEKIDFKERSAAFSDIVRHQLRSINNVLIKSSLVEKVLDLIILGKLSPEITLSREMNYFFSNPTDGKLFYAVSPVKVMLGLLNKSVGLTDFGRKAIVNHYLQTLGQPEDPLVNLTEQNLHKHFGEIFKFVANYTGEFDPQQLDLIRSSMEKYYAHNSILELFFTSQQLQDTFITKVFIENVVKGFSPIDSLTGGLHLFLVANAFLPAADYLNMVTDMLVGNFAVVFSPDNIEKKAPMLRSYGQAINAHLSRRAEAEGGAADRTLKTLLDSCLEFLRSSTIVEQLEYIELLMTLGRFNATKDAAVSLLGVLLVDSSEDALETLLSKKHELMHQDYASELEEQTLAAIVKFERLVEVVPDLPLGTIARAVVKYMEEGRVDVARELIITYRDQWNTQIRQAMLEEMVALFSFVHSGGRSLANFDTYLNLILFAAENDAHLLEIAGLWSHLGDVLADSDPLGIQRLAFEALEKYFDLISREQGLLLIGKLLTNLQSQRFNNNYIFNEALYRLFERLPDSGFEIEYMTFIYQQLIIHSVTTNVFNVCAMAIAKVEYDPLLFLEDIKSYLHRAQGMDEEQSRNAVIVFKAITEKIKEEKSATFKEIKVAIKKLK